MRINFSHATFEEADLRVKNLRLSAGSGQAAAAHGSLNLRAVMLDTQGPEIRTGSFAGGVKEVELCADDEVRLSVDPALRSAQTKELLWVSYLDLSSTVQEGSSVLLDDGAIELKVLRVSPEGVQCRVANTGVLGNKKGVNIPGHVLTLPAMSDKDRVDFKVRLSAHHAIITANYRVISGEWTTTWTTSRPPSLVAPLMWSRFAITSGGCRGRRASPRPIRCRLSLVRSRARRPLTTLMRSYGRATASWWPEETSEW
jgi:hypothetical protein